jgi:hypothetical protein
MTAFIIIAVVYNIPVCIAQAIHSAGATAAR